MSLLRQTPGRTGRWEGAEFVIDPNDPAPFDAWVVYERLDARERALCDPARTLLITGEPPAVRSYDPRFLNQFATILSPRTDLAHPRLIQQAAPIPWWSGLLVDYPHEREIRFDYDAFSTMTPPPKTKLLSLVTTRKNLTPEHRQRLVFVEKLQSALGNQLDIFGHGFTPIADKFDAIAPYRYHLVLENSVLPHYWSEKLADCFLAGAHPFYVGCPNISDYFPHASVTPIPQDNPDQAIAIIRAAITADLFTQHAAARAHARTLVLNIHNFFPAILSALAKLKPAQQHALTLRPEHDFTDPFPRRLKRSIRRTFALS